jgi:hypothetical protein
MDLVRHFKGPRPSVFAVTESGSEPYVSKGLARKVKKLTLEGKLNWLLEHTEEGIIRSALRRQPATPLQREAWQKCQQGDHAWMTGSSVFEGHAFTESRRLETLRKLSKTPLKRRDAPLSVTSTPVISVATRALTGAGRYSRNSDSRRGCSVGVQARLIGLSGSGTGGAAQTAAAA